LQANQRKSECKQVKIKSINYEKLKRNQKNTYRIEEKRDLKERERGMNWIVLCLDSCEVVYWWRVRASLNCLLRAYHSSSLGPFRGQSKFKTMIFRFSRGLALINWVNTQLPLKLWVSSIISLKLTKLQLPLKLHNVNQFTLSVKFLC